MSILATLLLLSPFFVIAQNEVTYNSNGVVSITTTQDSKDSYIFSQCSPYPTDKFDRSLASAHYLGDDIAFQMYMLKKTYTYVEEGTTTSPGEKTVVLKPTIYNSIKNLSRLYKKEIKSGALTTEQATENLSKHISIAMCVYAQSTEKMEDALRKAKTIQDIESIYSRVVFE